jgi:hypothetical protein
MKTGAFRDRGILTLAGCWSGVAIAAFLWPASLHLVEWSSRAPRVLALFPNPGWGPVAALVGTIPLLVTLLAMRLAGRSPRSGLETTAPLGALLLLALPFVPGVAERLPLLLILAGPLRWVLAGAAAGWWLWRLARACGWSWQPAIRPGRGAVPIGFLALYIGLGFYVTRVQGPGGDEPHYLVITHSLLADGDLRIENNHQRRDYEAFFAGHLPLHYLKRGAGDVIYSVHAPGLPALLVPAYAIGGYRGASIMISLMAALAMLAVFDLACLVATPRVAWLTTILIGATIPIAPHGWLIFPETPAALISAWAAVWLWRAGPVSAAQWAARGAALALLPWLHIKFVSLLVVLVAVLGARTRGRVRPLAAFAAPIALSLAAWFCAAYVMYGVADPFQPYGGRRAAPMEAANIPRGVLGLLFDQEFGLLIVSPVYALAGVGLWIARRRAGTWSLPGSLLVVGAFTLGVSQTYMWWGGWSVAARFLVPVLPWLAPLIALALARARGAVSRGVVGLLAVYSIAIFLVAIAVPRRYLLFDDRDGRGELVELFANRAPLTAVLPSFIADDWAAQLPAVAGWIAACAVAASAAWLVSRRRLFRSAAGAALACGVFLLAAASVLALPRAPLESRQRAAARGQMAVLERWDGASPAYDYRRGSWLDRSGLLEAGTVRFPEGTAGLANAKDAQLLAGRPDGLAAGPIDLPPGRYDVRVWLKHSLAATGDVRVLYRRTRRSVLAAAAVSANPLTIALQLPVAVSDVWITSNRVRAGDVRLIEVVPLEVAPVGQRPEVTGIRVMSAIDDRPGRYLMHLDDDTHPEGRSYWTRSTATGRVLVSPGGSPAIVVRVESGPMPIAAHVSIGSLEHDLRLEPGRPQEIRAEVAGVLVPIAARAGGSFVPAQVSSSPDSRRLGVRVSVRVAP